MTIDTGEDGTGGSMPRGGGRRFPFGTGRGGIVKVDRTAVAGGGGMLKEVFQTGAEGGGRPAVERGGNRLMR